MMSQKNAWCGAIGKSGITRLARRRFNSLPGFRVDRNTLNKEGNIKPGTKLGAKISPSIGVGRKSVMDMDGGKALAEIKAGQQMEQDYRITAAG
jgi:hypothetical protein